MQGGCDRGGKLAIRSGASCGLTSHDGTPMGQGSTGASHGSDNLPRVPVKHRKPIIGLTGGIGAGKSTVARIFESLGAAVIDFDRLAHEQFLDRSVIETLCEWWGEGVLTSDGSVDRQAVAAIVFEDPKQLARLEGLLYPRIGRARKDLVASFDGDPSVRAVVLEAPKLFEAGLAETCDAVIFVEADDEIRVRRVASSRGWPESELRRREKLLQPLDSKRTNADYLVANNSDIDDLRPKVERVLSAVLASFQ